MTSHVLSTMVFPKWFQEFFAFVEASPIAAEMKETVEGSEWHRESSVWVHTTMCLEHYWANAAANRTPRERDLTLMTLLFHDFGKTAAEETLERKDGSGTTYHRYAGHEPISANQFLSFVCEHEDATRLFFNQGYDWDDVRKIKIMIEHHLPYGLKNPTKVENFSQMITYSLGGDIQCFYDQLWSDCNGRISDNHEEKRQNVILWIDWFKSLPLKSAKLAPLTKTMYVLTGPVGAGKSTFTKAFIDAGGNQKVVISEDAYRQDLFATKVHWTKKHDNEVDDAKQFYADAWQYCFENPKEYADYANLRLKQAIDSGYTLILDRTNQTRKSRSKWVQSAKQAGYFIEAVEFYVSEKTSQERQHTRPDKAVPQHRTHQIYMAMESCWFPTEVDSFRIISPFEA